MSRAVWLGVAVLLAVLWGLFTFSSHQQFEIARRSAILDTAVVAKLVEEWALSNIGKIDDFAVSLETYMSLTGPSADLSTLLRRHKQNNPALFRVIDVLAPDGTLIATSDPAHGGAAARNFDSDQPATTETLIGLPRTVKGEMLIPVMQSLTDSDGKTRGAVVVEVDPDYFAGFYSGLGLPANASVHLFRTDGPLLARSNPALGEIGRSYPENALWSMLPDAPVGTLEAVERDGVSRIISYRVNGAIPLAVSIGFASERIYADARRRLLLHGLIGSILSIALVVATRGMLRQLARRAQTEEALAISAAAVASVRSGVVIASRRGSDLRIVQCNPAFERLVARPRSAIEGRIWSDITGAPAPEVDELSVLHLQTGASGIWVEVTMAPILDDRGEAAHYVAVMTDITARREAEDEILRAKEQAEAANRAKSEFLANMSHELRTPLNAIIGFADVIMQQLFGPVGTPRYAEYARDIRASGAHLLGIISDILDLAKIEAAQVVLEEGEVAVENLLSVCATLVGNRAAQSDVTIEIAADASVPALHGDELRLKQIVLNLLSNAVKFSEPGGVVRMASRVAADGGLEIEIADSGCGMTDAELKLALQPFRQVNSSVAKRAEGTGLGLPLAIRLTELHGGTIAIDTAGGRGTTVTVRLPPWRVRRPRHAA